MHEMNSLLQLFLLMLLPPQSWLPTYIWPDFIFLDTGSLFLLLNLKWNQIFEVSFNRYQLATLSYPPFFFF